MNNNDEGLRIIRWWKERLSKYAFQDPKMGLYTDQKWMNFVGTISSEVCVLRDYGYNVAWWNFHERNITFNDGVGMVMQKEIQKPIVFFHFSGFKANRFETISKNENYDSLPSKENIKRLFEVYNQELIEADYVTYSKMPYAYNCFENGIVISKLQRRLSRRLLSKGYQVKNPFQVDEKGFYALLAKNKLLVYSKETC